MNHYDDAETLIDIMELSRRLSVRVSTLRSWVFQGRLPVIRLGRCVRFSPSAIEAFIAQQNQGPASR
ncbi:helix-turn-helix domain-containing protein [Thermodesulfobacteriota bacterium]